MSDEATPETPSGSEQREGRWAEQRRARMGTWLAVAFGQLPLPLMLRRRRTPTIESADEALQRQASGELINELLAGGAVAASFTAASTVAKAQIEAKTQRRKNELDAETKRLEIHADVEKTRLQGPNPPLPPAP